MSPPAKRALKLLTCVVFSLAILDVAINVAFRYPADPMETSPGQLPMYFEFGRSTEGKLDRMTGTNRSNTAPITLSGWYDPLEVVENPARPGAMIATFYGMSHSVRMANALNRTSTAYAARSVAAPGATANWAYGAFLRDRGNANSRVVVLSLMSANLPMINTISPLTWNVSFPMPYTADRFYSTDQGLTVVHPPYSSFEAYRDIFRSPGQWRAARNFIARHDTMYDGFLMRRSALDDSSLFRLIRRAYGQRREGKMRAAVFGGFGFNPDSDQIKVANAIVRDFAANARKQGKLPVIFLVNSFGYSDHLFQALAATLKREDIPFLSSHSVVAPDDPRGYLPDSHFTDANDDRLARALAGVIGRAKVEESSSVGKTDSTVRSTS